MRYADISLDCMIINSVLNHPNISQVPKMSLYKLIIAKPIKRWSLLGMKPNKHNKLNRPQKDKINPQDQRETIVKFLVKVRNFD